MMTLIDLQLWLDLYKQQHNLQGCLKCYTLTPDSYLHILVDKTGVEALSKTQGQIRAVSAIIPTGQV